MTFPNDENTRFCGRRWCVRDACGLTCAVVTWLLITYGEFCVLTVMMASWPKHAIHQSVHAIIFHSLAFLAFSAHLRTMLTDPGVVPKKNATKEYIERLQFTRNSFIYKCAKCNSVKPERAHHCSICGRCVRRMDHHCPWVNNCVGENNQKYFVLFTFYIALLSSQTLYWSIWQFVLCIDGEWTDCSLFDPPVTTILLVFLLFEAILFAIFTFVMFGTQMSSICNDQTGIESLKKEHHYSGVNGWKNLQMVFGGPFSMDWLNPFRAPFVSKPSFEYSV